jgi:hypothetical protein
MISGLAVVMLFPGLAATADGQQPSSADSAGQSDSYWTRLALGAGVSLLAHESAHILTSLALGYHPYIAFDKGRPTVFSGIDSNLHRHDQFLFSAAGMTTQALIDEAILDIPHSRGGAFERGLLAGGIGTTLFYVTIGRNGSVSDISVMARTSSLSKTQLSLIFGGLSAIHALRISRDSSYAHFFVRPTQNGAALGVSF